MLFINNKYTIWYYNIINTAKSQNRKKLKKSNPEYVYYETHHIIPRSLLGSNELGNLVKLTAREHFICHWLLSKITTGTGRTSMIFALFSMKRMSVTQPRYTTNITSRVYENLRIERSNLVTQQLTKRVCSAETRQKISDAQKGIARKKHSLETKLKMSEAHKHRIPDSEETKRKKSISQTGKVSKLKGIPLSEERKAKLRKPKPVRTEEHKRKLGDAARKVAELKRLQN